MSWVHGRIPDAPGTYVVVVGGSMFLATWNDRDKRYYDGHRQIDPVWVNAHLRVPEWAQEDGSGDF